MTLGLVDGGSTAYHINLFAFAMTDNAWGQDKAFKDTLLFKLFHKGFEMGQNTELTRFIFRGPIPLLFRTKIDETDSRAKLKKKL